MSTPLPIIAITIGDPAGIGPEISLRAAAHEGVRASCRPVLVGDPCVLEAASASARYHGQIRVAQEATLATMLEKPVMHGVIDVLDTGALKKPVPLGKPCGAGGRASYAAIETAIRAAQAKHFDAVTTAPINKYALKLAGIDFIGHTEIFGEATQSPSYAMMMYSERLAIGLVTCHMPLAEVPRTLTRQRIVEVGTLLGDAVELIRRKQPRIAVLGLNPHAGEEGLLGSEDAGIVQPAIEELRQLGYDVTGPLPPDTAFTRTALSRFQAHLCLYHDQGLIPFKMISFEDGVNVTMGLPFPRTSVDHGTAYDLAGTGEASISSMVAAIELAAKLCGRKLSPAE